MRLRSKCVTSKQLCVAMFCNATATYQELKQSKLQPQSIGKVIQVPVSLVSHGIWRFLDDEVRHPQLVLDAIKCNSHAIEADSS
jgi:hypothetical protein